VNTIIYGEDIPLMHEIIDAAKEAGISAVIASDVAVMTYCNRVGQEVHLSTQLNISNIEALRFYAQFADVVVLARELNMEQVAEIWRQVEAEHICGPSGEQIRIEMFCHGALCMAISGKCYMSLHAANRSANRGECIQVCRRSYTATDNETGYQLDIDNKYIMSPKDLKTVRFIDKMMNAGVRVFKIEGRARGPEYVYTVVKCYKEAIQAVLDGTFTEERKDEWDERLATVFNRGFWDGYYQGQLMGEWNKNYGSNATERKVYIGKGVKYFSKLGVAEFTVEASTFKVGDKMLITGPTTGVMYVTADEIHDDKFAGFDDWMDKYQLLIDLGNEQAPLDEKYKTEQNLIDGCQSRVWLQADYIQKGFSPSEGEAGGGVIHFTAESDALIVKGIVALLIRVLSDHTPQEILDADLYFVEEIGLKEHLSPTRSNGLVAMVKQMRAYALAFSMKA